MAKWYGKVGYVISSEVEPGIYEMDVVEREYYGDTLRNISRWTPSGNVNDDVNISNQISIVADPFAYQKFHEIKYVEFMGAMWKVADITVQRPRLILTVGGVYNGNQAATTE